MKVFWRWWAWISAPWRKHRARHTVEELERRHATLVEHAEAKADAERRRQRRESAYRDRFAAARARQRRGRR